MTPLDIIDAHELQVESRLGFLECRCSCGDWEQSLKIGYAPVHEQAKDRFLKHVQQTRDALRGGEHV